MDKYPSDRLIWVLLVVTVAIGCVSFARREQLGWDANWVTKTLCEDMQVFNGGYKRCIDQYAPTGVGVPL